MILRTLKPNILAAQSFFLLGPRGCGKSTWAKNTFPQAVYIDLHDIDIYNMLSKNPSKIFELINSKSNKWVIIDEILEIPLLGFFIKRLAEEKKHTFVLISSSINMFSVKLSTLLNLELPVYRLFPLTTQELGKDFYLEKSLQNGHLPAVLQEANPQTFLQIYLYLFLREEVLQEKLTENFALFTRFFEVVTRCQCCEINLQSIARLTSTSQNVIMRYFEILEALFFSTRLPYFDKDSTKQPKFYLFDIGVYKAIRTKLPLACNKEMTDITLESLAFQEITALNTYYNYKYDLSYWLSPSGHEIDFVAKNSRNIIAFVTKNASSLTTKDYEGLIAFYETFPGAKTYFIYTGDKRYFYSNIEVIPASEALPEIAKILAQ